ncbi:MAG TPA: carboxypeptidase regulatory-like domain-containing protein [Terracidiphilus sp.]|nr:carboxypeptidase regulatory-like domain-containing protein [Terracidiphilus sp.]
MPSPATAQSFRGSILGAVSDSSGAAVFGAQVSAKNVDTGLERKTVTSSDGSYLIPELPIGTYDVTVAMASFQVSITNGVQVAVASQKRVDVVLKPGAVTQRVEVSASELPQVDTTSDVLGGVLSSGDIENLPLNGRDYQKAIYLTPGVAGSPDQISDSPGSYGVFSVNGARGRSNNFLLDGTDMNDGYRNDPAINEAGVFGTPATILPVDAVQELNVLSNYMPEYGRNAGAVINIVTRSGSNAIYGTFFDYFRNNAFDARNYFNFRPQPQAPFHNNQFGGALGGPIVKNSTFFFFDYEGQRESVGVVTLACVPDPAQIGADLAALGETANPVMQALLARNPFPKPNIAGTFGSSFVGREDTGCPNGPNASVISPSYNNLSSAIAKIDHTFHDNDLISGRYFFGDSSQAFPLALTASGGQLPGFDTVTPTRVQLVALSFVHVINSRMVNELRYGWNRFAEGFFPQDQSFQPSSIGLCNASTTDGCTGTAASNQGLPIILVGGHGSLSDPTSPFSQLGSTSSVPRHRIDTNHQVIDDFSWKLNKHDLKFGFEFRRTSVAQYFDKDFRGKLSFDSLSAFLSGTVDTGFGKSFDYFGNSLRHTFEDSFGLFLQDAYHVAPRLVLNYGLRWDYLGVVGEKNNLLSTITSFDPAGATITLTQVGTPGLDKLYNPDYKNFAPRASLAWNVFGNGKTVLRSGAGLFFDAFSQDFFLGHLPYPPFFDPGPAYNPIGPAQIIPASATGSITAGVPIYGPASCGSVECDIFSFDRNIRTPYMENYNLNLEQQLAGKVVLEVGYVGSQGHHLFRFRDLNQPSQATITASDIACGCILSYGVPRVFGNNPYGAFYIMQEESSAKSNYNSLQASLRINGWHGITSIANYVWSRSMDTASDGEDFEPNAAQPNDSTSPRREYGPSNFDVPRRLTWIFGYQLPRAGNNRLRNGWGLDSIVSMQSGQPFQFNYNFEDDFSGSGEGDDRPDQVGRPIYHERQPGNFVELSSFAIPCQITPSALANPFNSAQDCVPGTRHFGNLGRNALRGPQFKQWDVALYKGTAITDRLNVQFRAEFFNILNHANFANPFLPAFIADPAIGGFAISNGREVGSGGYPLVATGDVGIGNPFLGSGGPRGIQLALKFTYGTH